MTNAVFYSVSPYGTGTLETGDGTIEITSGVATLSVAQTGNIGVGVCVEYNSLECWIAPNRIAFTSGGTTELLTGTKIAGGTSGATGIVRAIEVTSGTWAGGDAAGWIYFESTTGTWNSSEQINRTKPTSSTNIATTNGSLEGNIGNGNTEFVVKTATGGTPSDQTSTAVTSINHEWASLADFESYFTNSSHINNTSLVSADVIAHACCYYDHDDQTADTNVVIVNFGTTGANNYFHAYTPTGGAESINSQRHTGKWDTTKYRQVIDHDGCRWQEEYVWFDGLQLDNQHADPTAALRIDDIGTGEAKISDSIVKCANNVGITVQVDGATAKLWNNIVQDCGGYGFKHQYGTAYINNCTSIDNIYGYWIKNVTASTLINCIGYSNTTKDFHRQDGNNPSVTYSASDDATADDWGGSGNRIDQTITFEDYDNDDFHLASTDAGAKDYGDDLSDDANLPIWRDIDGTERGTTWDIGADEYVGAGPSVSIPVIMHHLRQQGIS